MRDGETVVESLSVLDIQARARANLSALPERFRAPTDPEPYPVLRSEGLIALRERAAELHSAS
jgi:hypothetical protein